MPLKFLRLVESDCSSADDCADDCIENKSLVTFAMNRSVKLFAGVREAIGAPCVSMDTDPGMTALECREKLASLFPSAADLIRISRLAVSNNFVLDEYRLPSDASIEIALIPPVSGG